MATRSGGKKPQAKQTKTAKQKKPASFRDNLEDQETARPAPPPPPKSARLLGWAVAFTLLFLALAVASWGIWPTPSLDGSMDIRFPARAPETESPKEKTGDTGKAADEEKPTLTQTPIEVATAPPAGDISRRLAALEAGLASLENRPASAPAMVHALESIEATITALIDRMVDLESRLQRAEMSGERGWALVISAAELRAALRGSAPFSAELETFRGTLAGRHSGEGADGSLNAALAALESHASEGIPDMNTLSLEFAALAPRLVAVDSTDTPTNAAALEGEDWIAALRGRLGSLVTIRRTGAGVTGSTAEAVTARAEAALKAGSLTVAVSELETLQGDAAHMAAPWLAGARARLAAEQSLSGISRRVTAILARQKTRQAPDVKEGTGE